MATSLTQTDVFQYYESSGMRLTERIKAIVGNSKAAEIVNEKLEEFTLSKFSLTYKEPIALKALNAVRTGDLVLFVAKPEFNLPECIPFFRYTVGGNRAKVAVNLTNCIQQIDDGNGGFNYVVDDMRKLYVQLVSAYIQLMIPDPANYPVKAIEYGAAMWARMFCKVLNRTIGLSSNKDRYDAYYYFAVRFFMKYLIAAPDATVDAVSKAYLRTGTKSPLILMIESKVEDQGADMYKDLTTFCATLFNNDISGVKGMRLVAANPGEHLNASYFIRQFVTSYSQAAVMALASAPYFTWMVLCTQKKAYMCNIKALGDVFDGNEGARYTAGIFSSIT